MKAKAKYTQYVNKYIQKHIRAFAKVLRKVFIGRAEKTTKSKASNFQINAKIWNRTYKSDLNKQL